MAVTMIDPYQVARTSFEDSHLLAKLKKAVGVVRIVGSNYSDPSFIHSIITLDLKDELYEQVKADYDLVRQCILDPKRGFSDLSGRMGKFIQPRTKGAGHGSTSRAFYARTKFLAQFIDLEEY